MKRVAWIALVLGIAFVVIQAARVRSRPAPAVGNPVAKVANAQTADGERAEWEAGLGELSARDPAAFANLIKQITLLTELALARFGFNPGPLDGNLDAQTQEAIRRFEQSRHLPISGDPMSFATMKRVIADTNAMDHQPILLPPFRFEDAMWERGFVSVLGTWRRTGEPTAAPEQATSIVCERQTLLCRATTAVLTDSDASGHTLSVDTSAYAIDTWSAGEITTKIDSEHVRLRISRSTKSVVEERVQGGAIAKRSELTNGSAEYMGQFRDEQRIRASLLFVSPETREWLSTPKQ